MRDFIDDAGTPHGAVGSEARIVSLVPSLTELLFDLGLGDLVVGRTAYCVHPRGRVRSAVSVGGTKRINLDKFRSLAPTHAVVNIDETPRGLAEDLAACGAEVVVTHPIAVQDNLRIYRLLGGLFGRHEAAETLCGRFEAAFTSLSAAAADLPPRRVLYLIWKDPWMTVSRETYVSRMLDLVRWETVPGEAASRYPVVDLSSGILNAADLVLFSSEPFPFKETHLAAFRQAFPEHAHKAAPIDAEMVSWYGSRAVAGLGYLGELAGRASA